MRSTRTARPKIALHFPRLSVCNCASALITCGIYITSYVGGLQAKLQQMKLVAQMAKTRYVAAKILAYSCYWRRMTKLLNQHFHCTAFCSYSLAWPKLSCMYGKGARLVFRHEMSDLCLFFFYCFEVSW